MISQPDSAEHALEITDYLVLSVALDVVVLDSVAALVQIDPSLPAIKTAVSRMRNDENEKVREAASAFLQAPVHVLRYPV